MEIQLLLSEMKEEISSILCLYNQKIVLKDDTNSLYTDILMDNGNIKKMQIKKITRRCGGFIHLTICDKADISEKAFEIELNDTVYPLKTATEIIDFFKTFNNNKEKNAEQHCELESTLLQKAFPEISFTNKEMNLLKQLFYKYEGQDLSKAILFLLEDCNFHTEAAQLKDEKII